MNTESPAQILVFTIDRGRFAVPLANVDRAIRAVAVNPLADSPAIVLGVIDVHGEILPVVDMRRRLGLPEREILPTDQFVLARMDGLAFAIVADHVDGIMDVPPEGVIRLGDESGIVDGIVQVSSGMILLQNLKRFFTPEDRPILEAALLSRDVTSSDISAHAVS